MSTAIQDASSSLMLPPPLPTSNPATTLVEEARLTDEDIDSLISSLQPSTELDTLRSIELTIRETQLRRQKVEEETRAKIHALATSLSDLRKQSTRQAADWRSLAQHAETIEKLDNKNFNLAKKINEQESQLSAMQTEVQELKRMQEELEQVDVEDEVELDKDALCLRIFRGLGFLPSKTSTNEETTTTDEWSSIMVRSDTRNTAIQFDIHTAHLKQNEISPLILADQLWKAAE
ncbi:hypothetical protein NDA13_002264 [Ustilago tritici]|nr:hypothetical protein NDA13_002264 [Ustilago tritici]